jgi:hypothetical protein
MLLSKAIRKRTTIKVMRYLFIVIIVFFNAQAFAQLQTFNHSNKLAPRETFKWLDASDSVSRDRTTLLTIGYTGLYIGTMSWLYTQWYRDYPLSSFHSFNDLYEWEQMDKFAHVWNTYNIAKPVSQTFRWAGHSEKRAALYGAGVAFLFQTSVEVFDGFSEEWGFSNYDMLSNALGASIFLAQQIGWQEQRIVLKYSFHTTNYAQYRPEVLGSNLPERILKDYNGLTHWVTVNPASFMSSSTFKIPAWLSVAVGFGAEGMTGGEVNPNEVDGKPIPSFERYRQYYLGIDIDLARIKTKSRFLNDLFKIINIVHLPAPALELSPGRKPRWHAFYFYYSQ